MRTFLSVYPGQIFRMAKSGKFFEVERVKADSVSGFYVDHTGKMLTPPKDNEASFTLSFLDSYARLWNLDGAA